MTFRQLSKPYVVVVLLLLVLAGPAYLFVSTRYQAHIAGVAKATAALPHYGIAAGDSLTSLSSSDLATELSGMHNLGAGWVRLDFDWNAIQPDNAGSYDWTATDRVVSAASAHHLNVLGIIDFTPGWARDQACSGAKQCQPADPQQFATFAAALSRRYKGQGVHYWEIWNEPNTTQFWQPAPNLDRYTALLKAASSSLRRQDHAAVVLSGSTAPAATAGGQISPADFLSGLYGRGAKTAFDAVGDHPYTYPVPPTYQSEHAWAQMSTGPGSLRAIMAAHQDQGKKIWITEFGTPTGGPGPAADVGNYQLDAKPWHVTENLQAASLTDAIKLYKTYDWAGPLFIYSYQDAGTDDSTNENFFGLVRADGSAKPAYNAVKQAIAR